MRLLRRKKYLRNKVLKKARELMDTQMPRNTNFTSDSSRQRIAEIITDMIFDNFVVESKTRRSLENLRKK